MLRGFACAASLLVFTSACGPIGPIPGGALSGPVYRGKLPAWDFVSEIDTIQLETRPEEPHSVNVWCAESEGRLYVPTSMISGVEDPVKREWVRNVSEDPRVRVSIEGVIYELSAIKVEDPAEREAARAALVRKYEVVPAERASHAWIFRMQERS